MVHFILSSEKKTKKKKTLCYETSKQMVQHNWTQKTGAKETLTKKNNLA